MARRERSMVAKGIMFGVGFKEVFMSRFAGTFSPSRFTDGMTFEFNRRGNSKRTGGDLGVRVWNECRVDEKTGRGIPC